MVYWVRVLGSPVLYWARVLGSPVVYWVMGSRFPCGILGQGSTEVPQW